MILTPAQRKTLERALATATAEEERITYLETLAKVSPPMQERVRNLRDRQRWLLEFAQAALAADDASIRAR